MRCRLYLWQRGNYNLSLKCLTDCEVLGVGDW
jgi:hypothetical protein